MKQLHFFGPIVLSTLLISGLAYAQSTPQPTNWNYSPNLLLRLAGNAAQAGWPKMPLSVGEKKQIASVVTALITNLEPQKIVNAELKQAVQKAARTAALQSGSSITASGVAQNAVNAALNAINTYKQPVKTVTPVAQPKTSIGSSAPAQTAQQRASNLGHVLLQSTLARYQNQCPISSTAANNQNLSPWCQGINNLLAHQAEIDGGALSTVGFAIWQKVYNREKLLPLFTSKSGNETIADNTYFGSILSKTKLNPELFQQIFNALTQANLPTSIDALALPALDRANIAMAMFAAWTFAAIAFPNPQQANLRQQLAQQALQRLAGFFGISAQDIQKV